MNKPELTEKEAARRAAWRRFSEVSFGIFESIFFGGILAWIAWRVLGYLAGRNF